MGIDIYLKKESLREITPNELIAFTQITRIIASLRFWMSSLGKINKDEDKIFKIRDQMELFYVLISMLKEAKKTYFKEIEKQIKDKYITNDIERDLKVIRSEFNKGKKNQKGFNFLMQNIRDNISFHYKKSIYRDIVTNEHPSEDLRVAIAKSEKIIDCLYLLPYDTILTYIGNLVPEENKDNALDWLFDEATRNTHKFASILERIAGNFIKTNGYKKLESDVF
jgi:hypothetical protein